MKIDTNLLFFDPLFSKLIEPFHYETGSRTVEDVHRRTSDPGLQFIDGHRDILCVILEIRLRSVSDYLGFKHGILTLLNTHTSPLLVGRGTPCPL